MPNIVVLGLVLLLLSLLPGGGGRRKRLAIPEAEEAELDDLIEAEDHVAVLYHDSSKVGYRDPQNNAA